MIERPTASGRCLCGGISFDVSGPLRDVINCHCHRCRQFTGHHMAATSANTSDVAVNDPDSLLRWYHPVPEARYGFCGHCGSSLFWQSATSRDRMSICAGTLQPPTHLTTVEAWWIDDASDYHRRPELPEFTAERSD
jgi:hypothetical protein